MKSKSAEKIKMPSIDELLGVSGEESATDIEISRIHSFANHPFKVLDDDKMDDLVESIKQNGVLTPVLVRPDKNNSYEMISGHRRMHAAIKAGLETIPAIVRDMDDDDAVVVMVDANIQREELLPSEKAFAYKMKMDAMKRQAGRPSKNNSTQVGRNFETAELIGKETGESKNTIRRFIRLTELIPELLDYVDKKRLPFTVAVDISYIDKEIQTWLFEYIKENGTVKAVQVAALRTALEAGPITQAKMISMENEQIVIELKELLYMEFRRYLYRRKANVTAQSILLAIGYNINKLHHKIQAGRTGRHLFPLKQTA